ncbi:MAG TPA: hypothetical protein VKP30_20355 [Polyangiaceae bacterium]|nr:hypothetical protein [Polyangiaceae bacterium]
MSFSRRLLPPALLEGPALDAAMVGIGMLFTADAAPSANIEDTVLSASIAGMQDSDFRVLSVLATWLGVHHERLNADRLVKIVGAHDEPRTKAFWASVAQWLRSDRRLARLGRWSGGRTDLLPIGSDFQIRRRGEDPRFLDSPLRVPAGVLRDRQQDVLSPQELAKKHVVYRQRIIMGPTYRADMWALLEVEPALTPAELARQSYGSFATAWQVKRDFELVRGSESSAGKVRVRRAS